MQLIIRPIQIFDAELVAEFFSFQIDTTFSKTFPKEALEKAKKDFDKKKINLLLKAQDRIMLGAFMGNEVVGIMFGSSLNGGLASVIWIAVSSEMRGKGIGKQLMEVAFKAYKKLGAHKVVLYTETNEAKEFYRKAGMVQEGFHPKHWWNIDHYCLGKIL